MQLDNFFSTKVSSTIRSDFIHIISLNLLKNKAEKNNVNPVRLCQSSTSLFIEDIEYKYGIIKNRYAKKSESNHLMKAC